MKIFDFFVSGIVMVSGKVVFDVYLNFSLF